MHEARDTAWWSRAFASPSTGAVVCGDSYDPRAATARAAARRPVPDRASGVRAARHRAGRPPRPRGTPSRSRCSRRVVDRTGRSGLPPDVAVAVLAVAVPADGPARCRTRSAGTGGGRCLRRGPGRRARRRAGDGPGRRGGPGAGGARPRGCPGGCSWSAPGPGGRPICARPVRPWPGPAAAGTDLVTSLGAGAAADAVRALVEGLLLGGYSPPVAGTRDRSDSAAVAEIALVGRYPAAAVERGRVHAAATRLARDLANTPSNVKQPAWLADQAVAVAERAGLTSRSGTPIGWPPTGSAGCSRSAAARPSRRAWCGSTTGPDPAVAPARRGPALPAAGRPRRQRDHVRHRWLVDQAPRGHGGDEDRHGRGRGGARPCWSPARSSACAVR